MQATDAVHARPWLGLASFTEANAAQFFGREAEVAELVRRLSRKGLTVLFGQSGLGKTSMLQAGVVPRLREAGFAPVLLRMDYSTESPSCEAQMLSALGWSSDEGLWEQLHRRDRDGPAPLLIFDQFEEVFTLGQADEAGRAKAQSFLAQLADLVENRVPAALESRLDEDDSLFDRYDLQRADFRLLISLREDYLAHLEPLKAAMPGITQNRMRIAPMTGEQALQAVCGPGGELVSTETAEAIVCFVSGAKTIQHAEVEPALLSLILRELNEQRIAKQQAQITPDLLAGSHAAILSDFYERSLQDQPQGVRHFIEDQLLTDTGYRENVAEERVKQAFATAGAPQDALEQLVNRRLLRVEERLDRRRVELTHDTLCAVVAASRDNRRERERAEAAELQASEQQRQARAARAVAVRSRWVAGISATLGVAAIAASGLAYRYFSLAEQGRSNSQALTAYLLDDLAAEIAPTGRLDVVAQLAQRAVDYYDTLPAALRSDETVIRQAQALVQLGNARATQFRLVEGRQSIERARQLLDAVHPDPGAQPELHETRQLLLARALDAQGQVVYAERDFALGLKLAEQANALLSQLPPPRNGEAVSIHMLSRSFLAYFRLQRGQGREAAAAAQQVLKLARQHGGAEGGTDRRATGDLLNSSWNLVLSLKAAQEAEAAANLQTMLLSRAEWMLEQQPGHQIALEARAQLTRLQASERAQQRQIRQALALYARVQADYEQLVQNDPHNAIFGTGRASSLSWVGNLQVALGDISGALKSYQRAEATVQALADVPDTARKRLTALYRLAIFEMQLGELVRVRERMPSLRALAAQQSGADGLAARVTVDRLDVWLALASNQLDAAEASARRDLATLQQARPALGSLAPTEQKLIDGTEQWSRTVLGEVLLRQRRYPEALAELTRAEQLRDATATGRDNLHPRVWLALAQARAGQLDAARKTLAPAVQAYEDWAQQTHDDEEVRLEHGRVLLVLALSEPDKRRAHLKRARAIYDALPSEFRRIYNHRLWNDWINEELRKP